MTNKKTCALFLLLLQVYPILSMQEVSEKVSSSEKCFSIAQAAIKIYEQFDYEVMDNFIETQRLKYDNSLGQEQIESSRFYFHNKIYKIISRKLNRIGIFRSRILDIGLGQKDNTEEMGQNIKLLMHGFCLKLKLDIIINIIERTVDIIARNTKANAYYKAIDTEDKTIDPEETISAINNMIISIVSFTDDILFTSKLIERLRFYKQALIKNYYFGQRKCTFDDLISDTLFKIIQPVYNQISDHCSEKMSELEEEIVVYGAELPNGPIGLYSMKRSDLLTLTKKMSAEEKSGIIQHLFFNYWCGNSQMLVGEKKINEILSIIYDNHRESIGKLGYQGWNKRIADLIKIIKIASFIRPRALKLSRTIDDWSLLGPQAKCLYFVNNHISKCLINLILFHLHKSELSMVKDYLLFLWKKLGNVFFKKALMSILEIESPKSIKGKVASIECLEAALDVLSKESEVPKAIIIAVKKRSLKLKDISPISPKNANESTPNSY